MSSWDDEINRHTTELVNLTMKAADQGPEPLPEDELASLGKVIATERQLLIDAISALLEDEEPGQPRALASRRSMRDSSTDSRSLERSTMRESRRIGYDAAES